MSMSETKEVKVKKKKKLSKSGLIVIIGLTILAIPCLIFAGILGISALQTGSPREGNRFKNDLTIEITKDDVSEIQASLTSIANVQEVDVKVAQGQLKVYIDCDDTLSEEQVDAIVSDVYSKVTTKLPIQTYFTKSESSRMYDLQINVYTTVEDSANRQYKYLHKNSAEEQFSIDDMAHPKNQELVDELQGKNIVEEDAQEVPEE